MVQERVGGGYDEAGVRAALQVLAENDYISGIDTDQEPFPVRILTVTEKAFREVRGWPSTAGQSFLDALIDALDIAIEGSADLVERGKLIRWRDAVLDVGKGVAVNVVTAAMMSGKLPGT